MDAEKKVSSTRCWISSELPIPTISALEKSATLIAHPCELTCHTMKKFLFQDRDRKNKCIFHFATENQLEQKLYNGAWAWILLRLGSDLESVEACFVLFSDRQERMVVGYLFTDNEESSYEDVLRFLKTNSEVKLEQALEEEIWIQTCHEAQTELSSEMTDRRILKAKLDNHVPCFTPDRYQRVVEIEKDICKKNGETDLLCECLNDENCLLGVLVGHHQFSYDGVGDQIISETLDRSELPINLSKQKRKRIRAILRDNKKALKMRHVWSNTKSLPVDTTRLITLVFWQTLHHEFFTEFAEFFDQKDQKNVSDILLILLTYRQDALSRKEGIISDEALVSLTVWIDQVFCALETSLDRSFLGRYDFMGGIIDDPRIIDCLLAIGWDPLKEGPFAGCYSSPEISRIAAPYPYLQGKW